MLISFISKWKVHEQIDLNNDLILLSGDKFLLKAHCFGQIEIANYDFHGNYNLEHFIELFKDDNVWFIDRLEIMTYAEQIRVLYSLLKWLGKIKIIISTNSFEVINELNTLIILSEDFEGKNELIKKYKLEDVTTLKRSQVIGYQWNEAEKLLEEMTISKRGFEADAIEKFICDQRERSDDVYYSYIESLD